MGKRRIAGIVAGLLLLLLASGAGAARGWVGQSFPQVSGELRLAGLDGPVEVRRDAAGVPHIYATTQHDLFFAQGVVHAQDRLWQMDFQRRVGLGRLSELVGAPGVETDRFLRTLGTHRAAQQDWAALGDEARAALEAYSAGVNGYMATNPPLPIEYRLLGVAWEPWEPLHTLAWVKMLQWDLSGNWKEELVRAQLIERVGADTSALLLDGGIAPAADATGQRLGSPDLAALGDALALAGLSLGGESGRGSNAWVVAGSRSATGQPLLTSDPHLGIRMPGPWYVIGLHAPDLDVVGASLPGAPTVVMGHNTDFAWGMTNLALDSQDLYIERLNEAGDAYEWQGEMVPLTVRQEVIRVRGGAAVTVAVKETRHGPLLNEVVEGLERPLALRWYALAEPTHLADALLALNRATNRDEFLAALRQWDTPAQNFVYADREGNIGRVAAGVLPQRAAGAGLTPQSGWTGEAEWAAEPLPFAELPQLWNPPDGYLVSANENPFPADFESYTGTGWALPARAERIAEQLGARPTLTPDDLQSLQQDTLSLPAQWVVPWLVALKSDDIIVQRAQEQLAAWNEQMAGDLPGAGLYAVTHGFIVGEMVGDEVGAELVEQYLVYHSDHLRLVSELVEQPDHPLWDDTRTPDREDRDDILLRALQQTTDWLGRRFGDVPHEWFWDRLHVASFAHPLGVRPPLDRLFNRRVGLGGDSTTVNATAFSYPSGFAPTSIPSYRQVLDVGDWDNSRMIHPTGQSGQPFHPHYADMLAPWQRGELWPLPWSDDATAKASAGRVLRLVPGDQ